MEAEGDIESVRKERLHLLLFPSKPMQNPGLCGFRLATEGEHFINGFHAMDDEWLAKRFAPLDVFQEDLHLKRKGSGTDLVESAFANGQIGMVRGKFCWCGLVSLPGMDPPRIHVLLDDQFALSAGMVSVEIDEVFHGTGSYPEPPHGLHRRMRHMARPSPLMGPCLRNASMAYWLHVGVKRQEGGVSGEMNF